MTTQKHHDEAERIIRAAVYTLREEITDERPSFEDDVLTLANSFDPPLANLLAAQEELERFKSLSHPINEREAVVDSLQTAEKLCSQLRTENEALRKVARAAKEDVANHMAHYVDFSAIDSNSPDYVKGYKPKYPDSVVELNNAIAKLTAKGITL